MKQLSRTSKVALLLLTLALPAAAAGPTISDSPLTPFVIPANVGCLTFDVSFAPEAGKPNSGRTILFANSAIIQGPAFATLTNLSTNKSINVNISGPIRLLFTTNKIVEQGPTFSVLPPNLVPPNLPPVNLANGRLVLLFDNLGNLISVTFTGTAQNLCALLE